MPKQDTPETKHDDATVKLTLDLIEDAAETGLKKIFSEHIVQLVDKNRYTIFALLALILSAEMCAAEKVSAFSSGYDSGKMKALSDVKACLMTDMPVDPTTCIATVGNAPDAEQNFLNTFKEILEQ
ncbi:MAG: hypothetical protein NTX63_05350 [Candidatus Peregrinibacteria bacterium]|nr:hypothetical protein [Candidatus Peregrinibacteria bacterium]